MDWKTESDEDTLPCPHKQLSFHSSRSANQTARPRARNSIRCDFYLGDSHGSIPSEATARWFCLCHWRNWAHGCVARGRLYFEGKPSRLRGPRGNDLV